MYFLYNPSRNRGFIFGKKLKPALEVVIKQQEVDLKKFEKESSGV